MFPLPVVDADGVITCGQCGKTCANWLAVHEHYFGTHGQKYRDQHPDIKEAVAKEKRDKRESAKRAKTAPAVPTQQEPTPVVDAVDPEEAVDHSADGSWWTSGYWRDSSWSSWHKSGGWSDVGWNAEAPTQKTFSVVDPSRNLYTDGCVLYQLVEVPWSTIVSSQASRYDDVVISLAFRVSNIVRYLCCSTFQDFNTLRHL